ncbi:MAG TPA: hypothetical protein DD429_11525 [Clostridiaceae bacterium]|nr:hypothetical protein [Clostridiaceae bacterium]
MKIAVLDAQGAGLGLTVIKRIRKKLNSDVYVIALGTNATATSNMMKAGADTGITGENSICSFCKDNTFDCIIGPIGMMCSGGIKGEITAEISKSIFQLNCVKYIIPLKKHGIYIPGTRNLEIKEIIEEIIDDIRDHMEK